MKKLSYINKLKKKYPNTEFEFQKQNGLLVLLHDNESLEEDSEFSIML